MFFEANPLPWDLYASSSYTSYEEYWVDESYYDYYGYYHYDGHYERRYITRGYQYEGGFSWSLNFGVHF